MSITAHKQQQQKFHVSLSLAWPLLTLRNLPVAMLRYLSTRVQELFETEESRRERRAIWEQYCASWAEEPCFLCNDLDPTKKDLKFYTLKDLNSSQANKGCPGCAILIEGVQRSLSKWAYQKESDILDAHGDRSPKLNWNYSESSTLHMSVRYFSSSPIDLDLEYFVPAGKWWIS